MFLVTERSFSMFGLCVEQVARMANDGLLPAVRCARHFRFDPQRLRVWVGNGGAEGWRRTRAVSAISQSESMVMPSEVT
jgi:hypothetical protein